MQVSTDFDSCFRLRFDRIFDIWRANRSIRICSTRGLSLIRSGLWSDLQQALVLVWEPVQAEGLLNRCVLEGGGVNECISGVRLICTLRQTLRHDSLVLIDFVEWSWMELLRHLPRVHYHEKDLIQIRPYWLCGLDVRVTVALSPGWD